MNKAVEKQFIDCYEKEVDSVFRFFIMRTSQREIALDLVQETFLKYWQAMQKGGIGNERAYIFSIARNLLIDWYRKKKSVSLEEWSESEDGQRFDFPDETLRNPEETTCAKEVLQKINELPANQRELIYLRFVEDMSPQEMAKVFETSANAVSVRISRALEALRKILRINVN